MEKPRDKAAAKAALKALEAHGDRFMSMFDDDKSAVGKAGARTAKQANGMQSKAPSRANRQHAAAPSSSQEPDILAGLGPSSQAAAALEAAARKSPGSGIKPADRQAHSVQQQPQPQKRKGTDEIDAIMSALTASSKKAKLAGGSSIQGGGTTPRRVVPEVVAPKEAPIAATPIANLKRERQLFMSSKASKVHEVAHGAVDAGTPAAGEEQGDEDMSLSHEEFKKLQLEVERLGASALDKKARKKWQAAMLQRLGAQADKTPRTAARIGKGMAAKAVVREGRALEEAIEAGMVRKKGMGKKKAKARAASNDWGLQELGPGFKGGVLRVKPVKSPGGGGGAGGAAPRRRGAEKGGEKGAKKGGRRKGGLGNIQLGGGKAKSKGEKKGKKKASKLPF